MSGWHDEARRLRADGWTLQRIADRFSVSRQRVHQVTRPGARTTGKRGRPLGSYANPPWHDEARAMRAQGMLLVDIAQELDRAVTSVFRVLNPEMMARHRECSRARYHCKRAEPQP